MGFFKDLRTVSKQANELSKGYDAQAQLQQSMVAMQQANQMLEQQAVAARLASGAATPARLQVTGARDTGTVINLQPVLELDLLVQPEDGAPYPVTVQQTVPLSSAGRVVPGAALQGRVDPTQPQTVWIDWTA